MKVKNEHHQCPTCGFKGLETKPYEKIPEKVNYSEISPPYSKIWGQPSYEVCDCCGFEFGFDDEPGEGAEPETFEKYLANWAREGCNWFSPDERPVNWSLEVQLKEAGLKLNKD